MTNTIYFLAIGVCIGYSLISIYRILNNADPVLKYSNKWRQFRMERWGLLGAIPLIYIIRLTLNNFELLNFEIFEDKVTFFLMVCNICILSIMVSLGRRAYDVLFKSK